ncbi:MAG: thiolase family protein [Erysipelotrichaceae bacterium]|nr:thiolase family protein [Erysipelotrichaceae bacterium]
MNQTKLNKYSRSVSIIGVGCTPFMYTVDNEETNGLTEGELFGYAALKAMEDAGVEPKDVDFYFHGEASPLNSSNYITPNMQVANWFGMKGKGSIHHSEACCTGYLALEQAVNAVASGKYNCVLSGCVEFGDSVCVEDHPYKREKLEMGKFLETTKWIYDRCYTRQFMAGPTICFDDAAQAYALKYHLTDQQIDDTLNHMSINNRRNAAKDPLALERREYADLAKEAGFDDVMDYMRSPYNPKMGDYLRVGGMELKCDGAAAVIVCATDMVEELTHGKVKPIEVLGIGSSALEGNTPHLEIEGTKEAVRQVYEITGVKPDEIDLFYANDFIITSHLIAAEIAGYLPEGEGWKYVCEGRTAYDGDKPINTNGGRTSFGHAHAASGLADIYEAVKQMRNECGERQVKKLPKTTMLRGFGGGQNLAAIILRTKEI